MFSVRSTLGKIETTPQLGETFKKVCENAILSRKCTHQKWYVTKIMLSRETAPAVMYTAFIGYFKGILISTIQYTPRIPPIAAYLSVECSCPYAHNFGHVVFFVFVLMI